MANIRVRADGQISPKHSRFQQSAAKRLNSLVHSELGTADWRADLLQYMKDPARGA